MHGPGSRYFHLVDALPTLPSRMRKSEVIKRLFDVAVPSRDGGVPTVAIPSIRRLEAFLDSPQRERLEECRYNYTDSLARHVESADLFLFHERNRGVLPYDNGVLRFVALNDDSDLPNWESPWAVEWAIQASQYEPLTAKESNNEQ